MSFFDIIGNIKKYFVNTEEFVYDPYWGDTSNIPESWKHNDGRVYDPEYKYQSPRVSYTSNLYIDDNYTAEEYAEDNNMFSYPKRYPQRDTDRHPSGFTDIDRLDEKYYRQFRGDDITEPNDSVPIAPDGIAPNSKAPDSIAPDGIAPDGIAPDGIAPTDNTVPYNNIPKSEAICDMDILEINDCHKNLKILIWVLLSLCMVICIGFLIYILSYIFGNTNKSRTPTPTPYKTSSRPLPDPNQPGFFNRMFGSNKKQQPIMDSTKPPTPTNVRPLPDANRPGFMKRMFGSNNNPRSQLEKYQELK